MSKDVMRKVFTPVTADQVAAVNAIKDRGNDLHDFLESLPPSREMALAKTKLEEAVMWAVKAATAPIAG